LKSNNVVYVGSELLINIGAELEENFEDFAVTV